MTCTDQTTATTPEAATLTEAELFGRYLAAPVRVDATASTLIADHGTMFDTTARDRFLYESDGEFFSSDYAERLLAQIEGVESPLVLLECITSDMSNFLEALNTMRLDFSRLASVTRTEQPDEDAPDDAYDDWEDNPRYVLPVIEQKDAA